MKNQSITIDENEFWNSVRNSSGMGKREPFKETFRGFSFVTYDDGTIWCPTTKVAFGGRGAGIRKIKHHFRIGTSFETIFQESGMKPNSDFFSIEKVEKRRIKDEQRNEDIRIANEIRREKAVNRDPELIADLMKYHVGSELHKNTLSLHHTDIEENFFPKEYKSTKKNYFGSAATAVYNQNQIAILKKLESDSENEIYDFFKTGKSKRGTIGYYTMTEESSTRYFKALEKAKKTILEIHLENIINFK